MGRPWGMWGAVAAMWLATGVAVVTAVIITGSTVPLVALGIPLLFGGTSEVTRALPPGGEREEP